MRGKVWRNRANRMLAMIVSLLLAFFLWLALAGQDTSTMEFTVPLELIDLPSDLAIKTEVPGSVTIQVSANTAQGRFLSDRKLSFQLDVSSAQEGDNTFKISEDTLNLPRGVQIRKISPSAIEFEAVVLADKLVPLKMTTTGGVAPAFKVKSLAVEPSQASIRGPKELIQSISDISIAPVSIDGLTQNKIVEVGVAAGALPPGVTINPTEFRAAVIVEPITEVKNFTAIPIEIDRRNGGTAGVPLIVSPKTVDVSIAWPISRIKGVKPEEIKAKVYVDEDKLRNDGVLVLPVVVVPPEGTTATSINPPNATVRPSEAQALENAFEPAAAPADPVKKVH